MANCDIDHSSPIGASTRRFDLPSEIVRLAVSPFAAIVRFYRRRAVLTKLAGLDDHMLCDIGLQRFDIADATALDPADDVSRFLRRRANERRSAEQRRMWERTYHSGDRA